MIKLINKIIYRNCYCEYCKESNQDFKTPHKHFRLNKSEIKWGWSWIKYYYNKILIW